MSRRIKCAAEIECRQYIHDNAPHVGVKKYLRFPSNIFDGRSAFWMVRHLMNNGDSETDAWLSVLGIFRRIYG